MSILPIRFDVAGVSARWLTLHDGVMGGHSRGTATVHAGVLRFSGTTSLDDKGGFASIRARGAFDLRHATGVRLRVRGDGRDYQLRIATDARHRGSNVSWRGDFSTRDGAWQDVVVAFVDMQPTYRGTVLDGPALDVAKIEEVGLLIGDGQAGDFVLDVASIETDA